MKHLKLYEDFNSPMDDSDEPAYYVLKDGRLLYFWEETGKGMAEEPMGYYVYRVGPRSKFDDEMDEISTDIIKMEKENKEGYAEDIKRLKVRQAALHLMIKNEAPWEKAKEVTYKEIENLLSPEDKKQHEEERSDLGDQNANTAKRWVE